MPAAYRHVNPQKGNAILKAATALFLKSGYEKTSMEAIAKKAGVAVVAAVTDSKPGSEEQLEVVKEGN